jgi:hypothetical protein
LGRQRRHLSPKKPALTALTLRPCITVLVSDPGIRGKRTSKLRLNRQDFIGSQFPSPDL